MIRERGYRLRFFPILDLLDFRNENSKEKTCVIELKLIFSKNSFQLSSIAFTTTITTKPKIRDKSMFLLMYAKICLVDAQELRLQFFA